MLVVTNAHKMLLQQPRSVSFVLGLSGWVGLGDLAGIVTEGK